MGFPKLNTVLLEYSGRNVDKTLDVLTLTFGSVYFFQCLLLVFVTIDKLKKSSGLEE